MDSLQCPVLDFPGKKKSRLSQSDIFNPTDFTTQITIK